MATRNYKKEARETLGLNLENYYVGSFQRDTEGSDLITPKLEKGPDNLMKILLDYQKKHKNLKVILAGNRRDYLIKELNENTQNISLEKIIKIIKNKKK